MSKNIMERKRNVRKDERLNILDSKITRKRGKDRREEWW